jgi:small-conductance mechanosensitive channel
MNEIINNFFLLIEKLFQNVRIEEWLLFILFVAFALLIYWLIDQKVVKLIGHRLMKHNAYTTSQILNLIRLPLAITIFAYFTLMGLEQIKSMPETLNLRVQRIYPTANLAIILFFLYRSIDVLSLILRQYWEIRDNTLNGRWANIIAFVSKALIILIGGMTLLQMLGIPILPMLTGAGFIGAAFALASQSTLANAIGSLELIFDRPFQVGDRISFQEYDGFVTRMGIRSIEITSLTGERIILPNKDVVDKQIRNYSKSEDPELFGYTRILITVGIIYQHDRADIERAIDLLQSILSAHPKVKQATARFRALAASSLELIGIAWADYKTGTEFFAIQSELQLEIKDRFDHAGLEFAYPTQTIHFNPSLADAIRK